MSLDLSSITFLPKIENTRGTGSTWNDLTSNVVNIHDYYNNYNNNQTLNDDDDMNEINIKTRKKRFINYNVFGTLDVGFLLIIPFIIILPPMSNLFNTWKYKRSIRNFDEKQKDEIYYEDEPIFQPQLDKISTYFDLIQIPESSCQQRAICEFSSNPDKYFPISDIFLNQVRDSNLLLYNDRKEAMNFSNNVTQESNKQDNSLFKLYNRAADKGQSYGEEICHTEFSSKCPFSIQQRLNMPIFQFWKTIQNVLDIKIQDKIF